ncbi:hypothetical protein Anae109_4292 [Anaeromyxobacter sp. Fw109-5]|nr:hypothetical protein Anae109_4292 [Anaeromyxobacter sp. Fw109-5]
MAPRGGRGRVFVHPRRRTESSLTDDLPTDHPSEPRPSAEDSRPMVDAARRASYLFRRTMAERVFHLLAVSAVVMGIAQTVAKEKVFAPLRDALGGKDTWLGYLVSCPYCLSHWLAFLLVPLTGATYVRVAPRWGAASTILDWFLSSILVVVIAAFLRVGFWFVDESQGLVRRQQKTEEATARLVRERAEALREGADEPASGEGVERVDERAPPRH